MIKDEEGFLSDNTVEAHKMAIKALNQEPQWIPVSERLPEKEGLYLVSVKNDHERRYSKTCQYMGRNHWFARQDVEAWMPLPKPYEPQESNDKCKNCEYYRNPDYTRCHECKAERSDKE